MGSNEISVGKVVDHFLKSPRYSKKVDSYFDIYESLFSALKGKNVIFVEVGVKDGGSLHMWRSYLGSNARIIGVDLNPDARRFEDEGFEIFIGDQASEEFWDDFFCAVGDIDVLIDDGGHRYVQQIVTVLQVLPHIRDGGLVLVEDCDTSFRDGFGVRYLSFIKFSYRLVTDLFSKAEQVDRKGLEICDRIWSVQYFNSMVAIFVDGRLAKNSCSIANGGLATDHQCFRNDGNVNLTVLDAALAYKNILRFFPFAKHFNRMLRYVALNYWDCLRAISLFVSKYRR